MKEKLLKNIIKIVALLSLSLLFTSAKDISIKCPNVQADGRGLWECPPLEDSKNTFFAHLKNIDYSNGAYTCKYFYVEGKQGVQSCNYTSAKFVEHKEKVMATLNGSIDKNGGITPGLLSYEATRSASSPSKVEFDKVFSHTITAIASTPIKNLETEYNDLNQNLFKMWKESNTSIVHNALKRIKDITHKHLVEPYVNPNSAVERKGTFSNFVGGLIVLNPDMVEGYNSATGMLRITEEQKNLATTVGADNSDLEINEKSVSSGLSQWWDYSVTFDTALKKAGQRIEKEESTSSLREITSWLVIFEDKLWGYYYNLHRRLDVGFDVISTKLLFLMAVIFMLILGTKSGVGHLINKDHGHAHSEKNWMKALALMLGIGIFFISLPTVTVSDDDNGGYEMRKNRTIIKSVIRFSVDQGANFATMMSDLGTDAFLNHIVKKQKLSSVKEQRDNLAMELSSLYAYYPALETVMECKEYYEVGEKGFSSSNKAITNNHSNEWFDNAESKYRDFKIEGISLETCLEAYKVINRKPKELLFAIKESAAGLEDADDLIAIGTEHLIKNHIAISDRIGWMSSFLTPMSYLMLKNGDIYLSKGVDYDKVKSEVDKQLESWGIREDIHFSEVDSDGTLVVTSISDNLQYSAAYMISGAGNMLLYNILPGFSSMREGMEKYFQSIYRSKLDLHNGGKNGGDIVSIFSEIKKSFKGGPVGVVISELLGAIGSVENVLMWQSLIFMASFVMALVSWNLMFVTFFISSISLLLLLKTVLYFKDVMVHFFVSPFVALWAFAQAGGEGERRIWSFLRDTLILAIYPTLIVLGGFIFIFIYELMNILFAYLMNMMLGMQQANIGLMSEAKIKDSFTSYMHIESMRKLASILKEILGLFIAIVTIMKFPEYVLRKFGVNEQEAMMISNTTNEIHNKTERISNPLAG